MLPSFIFPNLLLFFLFFCCATVGVSTVSMYSIYLLQWFQNASVASWDTRHQTGDCSSRRKSDYLKENMHCSKVHCSKWLFHAHCGSRAAGGRNSKAQLFTLLPLSSTSRGKEGVCRRNPQNVLRIKPWNRKAHRFYTLPSSSCKETLCCLWFNMCSLLLLQMRGTCRGRRAQGASPSISR